MKSEAILKPFSALSFSENAIAGTSLPAPPQTERSRREGTVTVRGLMDNHPSNSPMVADQDQELREAVERSRKFREALLLRSMTPYIPTFLITTQG